MFLLTTLLAVAAPTTLPVSAPAIPQKPAQPAPPAPSGDGVCAQIGGTLCVPLDSTFEVVPFTGATCGANDDGSSALTLNGWNFDFYGVAWADLFVNNNGNLSFGTPFSAFSASGFPVAGFPMIAPFWGDVDTRGTGAVWFKELSVANGDAVNRLVITWDNVGYFSAATDLVSTFQVILTDGADPIIGLGNNVCFCYDDMQWTTGAASGGSGGFGGVPATVGANQGNGVDFFQVGRFDQPGDAYDGPDGANDGVDFLDDNTICFNVGASLSNIPPIFVAGDPVYEATVGLPLMFSVEAIGPESTQSVTVMNDGAGLAGFTSINVSGNPGASVVTYTPDGSDLGTQIVTFSAVDDGTPVEQSDLVVEIRVRPSAVIGTQLCDPAVPNSTGRPSRLWANGSDLASSNSISLIVADAPPAVFGMAVVSQEANFIPNPGGSQGDLCIASLRMGRYNQTMMFTSSAGTASQPIDLTMIPIEPDGFAMGLAGETWNWQFWHRDVVGGMNTSNLSNAVSVTLN